MSRTRASEFVRDPDGYAVALAEWEKTPEGIAHTQEHERWKRQEAAWIESDRKAEAARRARDTGVPPNSANLILFGSPDQTDAMRALTKVKGFVCLFGNTGVGKTVAATAWLLALNAEGCLFVKAAALARWDRYDNAEMERLLTAPRLVIDDLGTEYQDAKGNFMAIFDELVDVRDTHGLPTVATTNLDVADFKLRYGERVMDRVRGNGRLSVIGGDSMRGAI